MRPLYLMTVLSLAISLAACGEKSETKAPAGNNASEMAGTMDEKGNDMSGDMGNMTMPADAAAKTAKGTGTVTAIDKAAGTITLDHGPIAEANWPAMTMAFKAPPELVDSVKVGDKVGFDLALKNGTGEITAIAKQ